MKLCVRQGRLYETLSWYDRAAYLSGGGLSGGGLEESGGLQVKTQSTEATSGFVMHVYYRSNTLLCVQGGPLHVEIS